MQFLSLVFCTEDECSSGLVSVYPPRQECNSFLHPQIAARDSVYQSRTVPVPLYPPTERGRTFVGRVASQLLLITNPSSDRVRSGWRGWGGVQFYFANHRQTSVFFKVWRMVGPNGPREISVEVSP